MAFDDETVQAAWEKGRATSNMEATSWRKDECGAWMRREHYGNENSEYGWKIESVAPGPGAPDDVDSLRPFHLENGFDRNTGKARCRVTADREDLQPTAQIDTPHNRGA